MSSKRNKIKAKIIDKKDMCLPKNENIKPDISKNIFLPVQENETDFQIISLYYETENYEIKLDSNNKPILKKLSLIEERIDKYKDDIRKKSEKIALDLYFIYHNREEYKINNFKNYLEDRFKGEISRGYAYDIIKVTSLLIDTKKSLDLIKNIGMLKLTKTAQISDIDIRNKVLSEMENGIDYTSDELLQINKLKNILKKKMHNINNDTMIKDLFQESIDEIDIVSDNLTDLKPEIKISSYNNELIINFENESDKNDKIKKIEKILSRYFEIIKVK